MSAPTPQIAPAPQVLADHAREIAARIDQQRRRAHGVALATGLAMGVVVVCGWLLGETVSDFLWNHPWTTRLTFLVVGLGGAAALAWWFGIRLWRRRLDDETVALMIERALPAFRSRFIAAVQLAKMPEVSASPALVKALIAETTAMAATMDFTPVVDTAALRRWRKRAVWALLILVASGILGGSRTWPLVRRALLGANAVPRKTLILQVSAPRVVAIGDDWHLTAIAGGIVPARGRLLVHSSSGRTQTYPLDAEGSSSVFGRVLQSVQEPFSVTVSLGDADSDPLAVRVKPRPAAAGVECRQIFPAYTRLPAQRRALGDLKILAGSKLVLKVKASAAVKAGEIQLLGTERDKIVKSAPLSFEGKVGSQLVGEIAIPTEGVSGLTLRLVDEDGLESRRGAVYPLEIIPDRAPTVKILWPDRREELLTRDATLLLAFEAKDDLGVARVRLHYAVDWVEGAPHETIELDAGTARPRDLVRRFRWRIGQIIPHVEQGNVIDYWLEILDANDVSGPGVATLDHYQARIVGDAEKRADLANRLSDTMEGLNGIRLGQEETNRRLGEMIFEKAPEAR